jgi:plasmid stability protein
MSTLTIRNLDPALKAKLRVRAAEHGRSMEEEARVILRHALAATQPAPPADGLADAISAIVRPIGGLDDLELPPRWGMRDPPDFQ